jgi:Short C-terminal domain
MGILKTAATVAVASSVHGRIQRRQQQRWVTQDQAAAPAQPQAPMGAAPPPAQALAAEPAPAAPAQPVDMGAKLEQLKQLGELLQAGILTDAEFQQQKARILAG